jgi:hypothetical protein
MLDDEALRGFVLDAAFDSVEFSGNEAERMLLDYFNYVEKQFYKEEKKKLTEKISVAEKAGDEHQIAELQEQKVKLQKKEGQILAYMKK